MPKKTERRKWVREIIAETELGIIHGPAAKKKPSAREDRNGVPIYVGVHNRSPGGLLIDAPGVLRKGSKLNLTLFDSIRNKWATCETRVAWSRKAGDKECLAGLQFLPGKGDEHGLRLADLSKNTVVNDVDFLLDTALLKSIPRHAVWSLLNCLTVKNLPAGDRLMTQGEKGDSLYIIQHGSCIVKVEKEGVFHQIASLGKGDVVGEMAVLTGEPRYAEVFAESDMKLWQLGKDTFNSVSAEHPELREFLTELVTRRLESATHVADRTIGKYLIKLKLGHGAWSIVFQGIHQTLQMTVAIKMLKHQMAMDRDFQGRFKKEAEMIAQLHHRNIIQVYDIEELYKTVFIIMEYLEGEGLEDLLARVGRLSPGETVSILAQVCSGLAYAHAKGIVHQDIKPANILILPDGQVKILDFGLACTVGCESIDLEGTLFYMSPEQLEGEPVDIRTDVYSLGITAYEMITGQRPYPEKDLAALMDMHIEKDIPDPAKLVPDLPDALRTFITKACSRKPGARYQSMTDAADALKEMLHDRDTATHEKKMMTTLFFFYDDEHRGTMTRLLEEFSNKAGEAGIAVKAAEFKDVY